jgi:hypothetical protein
MKSFSKWFGAMSVIVVLAGTAAAADVVSSGKIKSINADKKEFVLTDSANKDWTFKVGDKVVVNRGGKEGSSDLKAGDPVSVCYDKGLLAWTSHYILVQTGDNKKCELMHGSAKSYDGDKNQLIFTDADGKDLTFNTGDVTVRLNMKESKAADVKIGDHTLAIVEKDGDKVTLKSLMIQRN